MTLRLMGERSNGGVGRRAGEERRGNSTASTDRQKLGKKKERGVRDRRWRRRGRGRQWREEGDGNNRWKHVDGDWKLGLWRGRAQGFKFITLQEKNPPPQSPLRSRDVDREIAMREGDIEKKRVVVAVVMIHLRVERNREDGSKNIRVISSRAIPKGLGKSTLLMIMSRVNSR